MIKNIGVDIVQNSRFAEIIDDDRKLVRILSLKELAIFKEITVEKRKLEYVSSRFACKEALIKAINKENITFNYCDISILNDSKNAPYFNLNFKINGILHLSLSHERDYSVAFVLYEEI